MNNTALITGAGGGLAQATARLLAENGWSLALVGPDQQTLEAVRADLEDDAPAPNDSIRIVLVQADITSGEGARHAVEATRRLLEEPVTGLVHCEADALYTLDAFVDQALDDAVSASLVFNGDGLGPLMQSAAATYAPAGLRFNAVKPASVLGGLEADQCPLDLWPEVLDTARTMRYLLGPESSWVTGQVMPVIGSDRAPVDSSRLGLRI